MNTEHSPISLRTIDGRQAYALQNLRGGTEIVLLGRPVNESRPRKPAPKRDQPSR